MEMAGNQDFNEDSNSMFSNSNFMPLIKRETNKKSQQQILCNTQEKIDSIGYQVVEELTIVTPLEVHPNKLCEEVETYNYQRKLPSVMDNELRKRQERQKIDFIMALTSLFRKSFTKITNKFSILLPNGGIIYFFMEDQENWPILVIASHNHDFSTPLTKEGIKVRELPKQEYERERIVVEGQYIQLFYGYFLNWILAKNLSIQIFSNYMFDYAFRQPPMVMQLADHRIQNEHLHYTEETAVGEKKSKLFVVKLQSMWYKEDIARIEEKVRFYQEDLQRKININGKIQHDFQFKICKFTAGLDQNAVAREEKQE